VTAIAQPGAEPYTTRTMTSRDVARFLARKFGPTRDTRMEMRVHPEQAAAYAEAAKIEGDPDVSAWARRTLDAAARRVIREDQ
jgi:hypothetical protein